ncbi:sugar ABC transporter permease [Martelella endophytica]
MADQMMTGQRPAAPGFWRRNQRRLAPILFLAPAVIMFTVFVVVPVIESLRLSLYDWDGLSAPRFIGLGNYVELFRDDPVFWTALKNNIYWLVAFLVSPALGLLLALFLNQSGFGMRFVKSLYFMPFVISQVVVGLMFSWFFNADFGLLNHILEGFGLPPVALLESENSATFVIIAAGLWPQVAYCMILYLTGLTAINPELLEAARMEGVKGFKLLWHIVLPQLKPATSIALIVSVVGALRSFDLVSVMTDGGPYQSSTVLAYYMYEQTFGAFRIGYGAAIASCLFFLMDICIVIYLIRSLPRARAR